MLPYFIGNNIADLILPSFNENYSKEGLIYEQLNIELNNKADEEAFENFK